MGILSTLKKMFKKKEGKKEEDKESSQTDHFAHEALMKRFTIDHERSEALQIDGHTLSLGIAAGYMGRSLRNIEDSLLRIESLMVTKDWFKSEFEDLSPKILQTLEALQSALKEHEERERERFEALMSALKRFEALAERSPSDLKEKMLEEIDRMKQALHLTSQMEKILKIIEEKGEVSYEELKEILGYKSVSTVRGLLSEIERRTRKIERFRKNGKGWVRIKSDS